MRCFLCIFLSMHKHVLYLLTKEYGHWRLLVLLCRKWHLFVGYWHRAAVQSTNTWGIIRCHHVQIRCAHYLSLRSCSHSACMNKHLSGRFPRNCANEPAQFRFYKFLTVSSRSDQVGKIICGCTLYLKFFPSHGRLAWEEAAINWQGKASEYTWT